MGFKSQDDNPHSFTVKTDDVNFKLEQDISAYRDHAKEMRDKFAEIPTWARPHYRSFCIIPDIVAIAILTKYNIDIHSPEFMHDTDAKNKVKRIISEEYPDLLTSNIRRV